MVVVVEVGVVVGKEPVFVTPLLLSLNSDARSARAGTCRDRCYNAMCRLMQVPCSHS